MTIKVDKTILKTIKFDDLPPYSWFMLPDCTNVYFYCTVHIVKFRNGMETIEIGRKDDFLGYEVYPIHPDVNFRIK